MSEIPNTRIRQELEHLRWILDSVARGSTVLVSLLSPEENTHTIKSMRSNWEIIDTCPEWQVIRTRPEYLNSDTTKTAQFNVYKGWMENTKTVYNR